LRILISTLRRPSQALIVLVLLGFVDPP